MSNHSTPSPNVCRCHPDISIINDISQRHLRFEIKKRLKCETDHHKTIKRTNEHLTRPHKSFPVISTTITVTITVTTMKYSTPNAIILYALFTLVALSFQESCLVLAKKVQGDADDAGDDKLTQKQAVTTVANLDANDVTLEEIDFFDQVWLTAFNSVYSMNSNGDNNLTAIAVQMEDKKMSIQPGDNDRRQLRGYFNYFDFFIRIDFRCRFCPDYRRTLKSNNSNKSKSNSSGSGKKKKKKRAPVQAMHQAFERTLCDNLREGPYDVYRDVRQCQVTFADN